MGERLIERICLLDALDAVRSRPLTVVAAPAGYGKTTAVAQWCRTRCPETTWTDHPTALPDAGVVVLDDFAGSIPELAAAVRTRPDLHVVVLTRRQVGEELAALRVDGTVHVLGTRDLRFTVDELAELLGVDAELAAAVDEELEGWAAGAVLVALDWDPTATVRDHRAVLAAGYRAAAALAAAHVVDGLDDDQRDFVDAIAVLPEISAALCARVLDQRDGGRRLVTLEADGRFLAPSRSGPGLVRFHPLARRGLREPDDDVDKHLRSAADWYEEQKLPLLSAVCFAEVQDWDAMANVLLANLHALILDDRLPDVAAFLSTSVPATVLQSRFLWTIGLGAALTATGDIPALLALVATVEPGASAAQRIVMVPFRLAATAYLEDPTPCLDAAEVALALCDEVGEDAEYEDLYTTSRTAHWRATARGGALVTGAFIGAWDRVARHAVAIDPTVKVELPPSALIVVHGRRAIYGALGGWLADAGQDAAEGRRLTPPGDAFATTYVDQLIGLAEAWIDLGRGRLDAVPALAAASLAQAAPRNLQNFVALAVAVQAHAAIDAGRADEALRLLDERAAATAFRPPPVVAGLLASAEALAAVRCGDGRRAASVLGRAPRTSAVTATSMVIGLEQRDTAGAAAALAAWPDEPTATSAVWRAVGRAAVAEATGARDDATRHLAEGVALAAPQGLRQPFARLGVHLLRPLRVLAGADRDGFVGDLVAAVDGDADAIGRLTNRERLVLHHLAATDSLPALAAQLQVSVNTLKSQVRAIYRKLGVSSRAEAVAAARGEVSGPSAPR